MGRSASHVALECALQTHPNLTFIGEEIAEKKMTLSYLVSQMADVIERRAQYHKNYGIILIPEGVIEFIPEVTHLIKELNRLVHENKEEEVYQKLSVNAQKTFDLLPEAIKKQLLADRDSHGNVQVSHIETEKMFMELVSKELKKRSFSQPFSCIPHFFGYEGRSAYPSYFDAHYCWALGYVAALLIRSELTGYICAIENLVKPVSEWKPLGIPLTHFMRLEERKGKKKAVFGKAHVDLSASPFECFSKEREHWMMDDAYTFPGPLQFFGPPAVIDTRPITLQLEQKNCVSTY